MTEKPLSSLDTESCPSPHASVQEGCAQVFRELLFPIAFDGT
jgi:hypothetical protein